MDTQQERRLIELDRLLRSKRSRTLEEIRAELKSRGFRVSTRTFANDRKQLEDLTGEEIICNRDGGEYRYTYKSDDPSPLKFKLIEDEHLRALYLAQKALENTQGIPEADDIGEAIENLEERLSNYGYAVKRPRVHEVVSFARSPMKPVDPEIWRTVYDAVAENCRLVIHYQKGWSKEEGPGERHSLIPLRIINLQGEWYLLANKGTSKKKIRQFHLSRVDKAEKKGRYGRLPEGLDLHVAACMENTFGRFVGDPHDLHHVRLRFSANVYPIVSGHHYHPKQKATKLDNGGLEITFPVTAAGVNDTWRFYHVRSWILSFGEDCEVMEPKELKDLVKGDLERALSRCTPSD